jgi:hypothetical protein
MMSSYRADLERLAKDYGFTISNTRSGHYALRSATLRRTIFAASTPRRRDFVLVAIEADLKRAISGYHDRHSAVREPATGGAQDCARG